jgi:hypothetical protein
MKFIHYAVLVCILIISCEIEFPPDDVVQFDQAQFDQERSAWNASNVKNYRFDMYLDGMGLRSIIRFVVENGAFKKREIIQSGDKDYFYQNGFTIQEFYAKIDRTVQTARKDYQGRDPDEIRYSVYVVYNTQHHYPVSMYASELHAVGNDTFESGIGDEVICSIRNFERGTW